MPLTIEAKIERIRELDLEPIVSKLVTPEGEEPAKMTPDQADNAVSLYRQFLILNLRYPSECIPPNRLIDEVWHAHILDTGKYRVDCDDIFGYYLDHFPYLGLRGSDDAVRQREAFATTQQLFLSEFGIDLTAVDDLPTRCSTIARVPVISANGA